MKKQKLFKKIGISTLFFIVSLVLYFLTLYFNEVNLSFLLPILIFINLILAILYSISNYQKKYIIIAVILIIFHGLIVSWNFSVCGKFMPKMGPISSCECIGLKKTSFLPAEEQCIGLRKKCFVYEDYSKDSKKEVDCGDGDNIVCGDLNLDECKNNNQCIQLGGEIEMWGAENDEAFNEWEFLPEKCVTRKSEFANCEYLVVTGNTSNPSIFDECRCIVEEIKGGRGNHLQLCPEN